MKLSPEYESAKRQIEIDRANRDKNVSNKKAVTNKKELEDTMFLIENMSFLKEQVSSFRGHNKRDGIINYVNTMYGYNIIITPKISRLLSKNFIFSRNVYIFIEYIIFVFMLWACVNVVFYCTDDTSDRFIYTGIAGIIMTLIFLFYDSKKV